MAKGVKGQSAAKTVTARREDNANANGDMPWLSSYPAGVPYEIDLEGITSVGDMIINSARQFSNKPAFSCMGQD